MSLSRFERELLASGKTSAPSAERRQAAKVAVMRAAGVAAAAATLTVSSTAAGATAGATASATATTGVKALGLVKLVLLAVVAASAIGVVAVVTSRSSAPTAPAMIAAPDVSAALGQGAAPSTAPATPVDDSPPAIASVPVSSLPNAPASAFAPASARTAPSPAASASASAPVPREPATEEDPLATEVRLLEAARVCLAKGDRACAQAKLDEHEARFARGPLADEAALLAIDVALAGGDRGKARRLARSLVARSPHRAWNARVKALAQEEDGPP